MFHIMKQLLRYQFILSLLLRIVSVTYKETHMELQNYLQNNKLSLRGFARTCNVSPATMMRVRNKSVVPSRRLMERIYMETKCQVAPCDLVGLHCIELHPSSVTELSDTCVGHEQADTSTIEHS